MKSEFLLAFNEIAELRKLPRETVMDALSAALTSAYRRDTGIPATNEVEVRFDETTGAPAIWAEKTVVESVEDSVTEVSLKTARTFDAEVQVGEALLVEDTPDGFGRIAAQTAKQVILQRMREAERDAQYEEFMERVGDLITGTVQNDNGDVVTVSLGRSEAILPRSQQMQNERYRMHDKVRAYVMEVRKTSRGPQIIISRTHRNMLRRLLEYEVPEIYNGTVEIKSIAREPGARSKVAVYSNQPGADPVGACVGMRGIRIQSIVKELSNEKIDVIEWSPEEEVFIAKALSPARVSVVFLDDDPDAGRTATVVVPDDQLSLAIGREGQNARLAAKLTGWRIDIKSIAEMAFETFDHIHEEEELKELVETNTPLIERVSIILEKKENNRPVMPEEYKDLVGFVELIEGYRSDLREEGRVDRRAEIIAARESVPNIAYDVPLDRTSLALSAYRMLTDNRYRNAGQVIEQYQVDPTAFERLRGYNEDILEAIGRFVETFDEEEFIAEMEEAEEELEAEEEEAAPEAEEELEAEIIEDEIAEVTDEEPVEAVSEAEEEPVTEDETEYLRQEELERQRRAEVVARMAEQGFDPTRVEKDEAPEEVEEPEAVEDTIEEDDGEEDDDHDDHIDALDDWDDEDFEGDDEELERRKARQRRRQLVYDEDLGRVVSRRRRKGSRARDKWQDYTMEDIEDEF